jgi:CHAD domain-containing protein
MLPGVESGEIGAVHRTRIASRRLRELLPVLQLEGASVRKLNKRLRKVTRRLGHVRELDALIEIIDDLQGAEAVPERALKHVRDEVRKSRDHARVRLAHKAVATELRRAARKLESVLADLEKSDLGRSRAQSWRWAIDARVTHRAAALKSAIEEAGAMYLPERIHIVRLATKKMRYAVELLAEASGTKDSTELRTLKRAQDLLGRLRDLQVLIDCVRSIQAALNPPDVGAWRDLDALVTPLEHRCRRVHARFVRDRVTLVTFCDRLGARTASAAARRAG